MSESKKTFPQVLLPSPNWYCSNVVSLSTGGLLAYGARSDVVFLQLTHETSNQGDSCVSKVSVASNMMMTRCHKDRVTFVRHADADGLYTGGEDGKVKYWSLSKRKCLNEHQEHKSKVTCGEIFGNDIVLSGDEKGNIVCWNRQNSMFNAAKLTNSPVFSISSCLERNCCAVGLKSGRIYMYDVIVHRITLELKGHDEEIHSLSWRPQAPEHNDNSALISGSRDKTLRLWDLESGKCVTVAKLPSVGGGRPRQDKERIWTCTEWLSSGHIIASTPSGDLLSCVLSGKSSHWSSMISDSSKKHNRLVFSLTLWPGKNILISNSMDRNVIVWGFNLPSAALDSTSSASEIENIGDGLSWRNKSNHDKQVAQCQGYSTLVLPTLGGYAYCVRASPVDPGRLAVGVGDNLIRLWNVNEGVEEYSVSSVWQGLKSKVTALAWHPFTENQLAYGTEDGRVGVFPALTRKPPIISDTYHQKMVYVISWGPPILSTGDVTKLMHVYSVGDGTVLIHKLTKDTHQPVQDLNKLISDVNSSIRPKIRSDLTWTADYSKLIVGSEDGTILILQRHDLKCLCTIKVCSKLVNALRLQPKGFLLAVGSNEHHVQIVDLTNLLRGEEELLDQRLITDSVRTLKGHKSRVTDMCWNVHPNSQLLTVSYDGSAIIWNVKEGVVLSLYKKQGGHVLTCQWSVLDTDMVYTGSDEFSLHSWRPSDYIKQVTTKSDTQTEQSTHNGETMNDSSDEIMRLLEEKKALLQIQELSTPDIAESAELKHTKTSAVQKNRRRNTKSYFPNMAAALKQDKSAELNDLISVYKCVTDGTSVITDGREHLGVFSPLLSDFEAFMEKEKFCLQADGSHDSAYQMMIWQGDVSEALEIAANNKNLSDWLVNAASMLSFEHWIKYCRLYARQLKGEGQTHKAALYLLYTHDVDEAIAWLVEAGLYREALCIARSRYPVGCERITSLYKQWSIQIRKDANYDLAAKCLVTLEEPAEALAILDRRQDIQSAMKAVEFGVMIPACHADVHAIAEKLTRQCLVIGEYEQLELLCKLHPSLQVYKAWSIVHRELEPVLTAGRSSRYIPGQILSYMRSKLVDEGIDLNLCVRGMPVSQMYIDQAQVQVGIAERVLHAVSVLSQPDHTDQALQDVLLQACVTLIASRWLEYSSAASSTLPDQVLLLYHDDLQIWKLVLGADWKPSSCLSELALPIIYLWSAVNLTVWPAFLSLLPDSTEQTSHHVADTSSHSENHNLSTKMSTEDLSTGGNDDVEMLKLTRQHVYEVVFLLCNGLTLPWLEPSSVQTLISHCDTLKGIKTQHGMMVAINQLDMVLLLSYLDEQNVCKLDRKSTKYVMVLLLDLVRKLSVVSHFVHFTPHLPGQSEAETLIRDWLNLHSVTNCESTS